MTDKIETDANGFALPPRQELALATEALSMALYAMDNAKTTWDEKASAHNSYAFAYKAIYEAHKEQVDVAAARLNNMLAELTAGRNTPAP